MVRKQDRQLETDIRATALTLALIDAGLRPPIRFRAENQKEPTELLWSHKDGRLSVYVNPKGGFTIEDVPHNEVVTDDLKTIEEVVETLAPFSFLWDYSRARNDPAQAPVEKNADTDEDGFPTV
jgi:hypothetical protein